MAKAIVAAGGALWRPSKSGKPKVAVVHRPRYDDWSLPKGKAKSGETLPVTAAREIAEETGFSVALGRLLHETEYRVGSGADKYVAYWSARALGGSFKPNSEVDELRWLPVDEARKRVSYRADKRVLDAFGELPAEELHTFLFVRHAKAGVKGGYDGPDRNRPLDATGKEQARSLVPLLKVFGPQRLHAADRRRCVQTLAPLAQELRTAVSVEPTLTEEAYADDPDAAYKRLRQLARDTSSVHVVCSQGGAMPPLLARWAADSKLKVPGQINNRKASLWVLTTRGGSLVAADYFDSPFA